MEITKDNLWQAIKALRQCADAHRNDVTPTFYIRVTDLCEDVANYLDKIKIAEIVDLPNDNAIQKKIEEEWSWYVYECMDKDEVHDKDSFIEGFNSAINWIKSKVIR